AASLCARCGRPETPAGTVCDVCYKVQAESKKNRKAKGINLAPLEGPALARKRAKDRENSQRIREKRLAAGLCPGCGTARNGDYVNCAQCRLKDNERRRQLQLNQPLKPTHPRNITSKPGAINPRVIDLTGRRFGRLTVIAFAGHKGRSIRWECLCDCGQ